MSRLLRFAGPTAVIVLLLAATPTASRAQDVGGFAAEVGLTALLDSGELGVSLGASYRLTDVISANAAFSYFFCDDSGSVSITCYGFDINGRYMLTDMFYALGGINYAKVSADIAGFGGSASDFGLNIGAGADLGFFFAEARFALGGWDDLVAVAGVRFPLGRKN